MKTPGRREYDHLLPKDGEEPNTLQLLVAHAVGEALDARFWQMTAIAVIVSLVVSLAVVLPITLWTASDTRASAKSASQFNCGTLKGISAILGSGDPSDPELKGLKQYPSAGGGFLSTDAYLRDQQSLKQKQISALRPGALKSLFTDPETTRLSKQSQQLEAAITGYWKSVLVPRLEAQARTNCGVLGQ